MAEMSTSLHPNKDWYQPLIVAKVFYNLIVVFQLGQANLEPLPPPCSDVHPVNILESAVPSPNSLPRGVNIIYDRPSHVHGFQFSPDSSDIYLKADQILVHCSYFPYEFSLFITFKQFVLPRREQCIFSLFQEATKDNLISVGLSRNRIIFRYKGKRYRFRMTYGYHDRKWHTLGVSMAGQMVTVTRDCKGRRGRRLRMPFPDLLPVANTSFSIGRCQKKNSVFQGLLKSVILVPGGDASARACPPKMGIFQGLNNVIRTFPGYSPLTQFYSRPAVCEWTDVGNIAFDVHANKLKVCVNGIWREVKVDTDKRRLDYLVSYQTLDTGQGSLDVEIFDLPGEGKFAIFASAGTSGSVPSRSSLYRWNDGKFSLYQRLPSQAAQAWEFFPIGNQFFLAVANYGPNPSIASNSTIFKWSKKRKKFRHHQDILTFTSRDVEAFQIDENFYLAIANHAKGDQNRIDSVIYKWSKQENLFLEHQRVRTVGAYDWTHFTVDGYHFLVVANAFTGLTTLAFSVLYVWQNNTWIQYQTMETNGATDWEHFTIDNDHFLVVANAYNYGSQNFQDIDSYRTNSTIYKLDRTSRTFIKYQSIETNSAIDWEYLNIGDDHFLLVSNAQNGGTGDRLLSVLYRWQGLDKFVPVQYLHTLPNADFEIFKDKSDIFLVYANAKTSDSQILRVKFM